MLLSLFFFVEMLNRRVQDARIHLFIISIGRNTEPIFQGVIVFCFQSYDFIVVSLPLFEFLLYFKAFVLCRVVVFYGCTQIFISLFYVTFSIYDFSFKVFFGIFGNLCDKIRIFLPALLAAIIILFELHFFFQHFPY